LKELINVQCDINSALLCPESEEVAYIACYVAKKILKRISCSICSEQLMGNSTESPYFHHLSSGGLVHLHAPRLKLCANILRFCSSMVLLFNISLTYPLVIVRGVHMLKDYLGEFDVVCSLHLKDGIVKTIKLLPIYLLTTSKT